MHLRLTPSLLGAALAATLLVASPAAAKPSNLSPHAAQEAARAINQPAPEQDLRGEHAQDAARAITHAPPPKQDLRGEQARYPDQPPATPARPAKSAPALHDNGSRPDTWLLVALGLAGVVIVAAGTSGFARARRMA